MINSRNSSLISLLLFPIIVLILCSCLSCKNDTTSNKTIISVAITNHKNIDSIIVYDKTNSWHIASCIRFAKSSRATDTVIDIEHKLYQLYLFSAGKQSSFGEIVLSPNSNITLKLNENAPYASATYSGDHNNSNNYLAFLSKTEKALSTKIMKGMDTAVLKDLLIQNKSFIKDKGFALKIPDSIASTGLKQFEDFSSVLQKKNTKYAYKSSLVGKNGNEFYLKSSIKDSVSLSSFKGKYLYIDVWATWCKPCKVEYPLLKALEKELSSSNSIDIISISMDREFDKWAAYVENNDMKGYHFHTKHNSEFVKFYDIGALPRFILIDPNGLIVSADAMRPSDPQIRNYLKSIMDRPIE